MIIYIPTAGRQQDQKTEYALKLAGLPYFMVAPTGERHSAEKLLWCPKSGIRDTRNWILDQHENILANGSMTPDPKLVMLDDDLIFWTRSVDGKIFTRSTPDQLVSMFDMLDSTLENYAHGGIVEKFMSYAQPRGIICNKRYFHVLAYNTALFPNPPPRAEAQVGEDHDINLQLMLAGRPNFVLTEWSNTDKAYANGGCSIWRTEETEVEAGKFLERKYPGIVKLVEELGKKPKLRIQWREAIRRGGCNV